MQHTSLIADALTAILGAAQSPALKRKICRLVDREGVDRHVWESIVSYTKPPTVPAPKVASHTRSNQDMTQPGLSSLGLESNLMCFGEDLLAPDSQSSMNGTAQGPLNGEIVPMVDIHPDAFRDEFSFGEAGYAEAAFDGHEVRYPDAADCVISFGTDCFTP